MLLELDLRMLLYFIWKIICSEEEHKTLIFVKQASKWGACYIGESLFTIFASLAYVPLFLLELQNRLF